MKVFSEAGEVCKEVLQVCGHAFGGVGPGYGAPFFAFEEAAFLGAEVEED